MTNKTKVFRGLLLALLIANATVMMSACGENGDVDDKSTSPSEKLLANGGKIEISVENFPDKNFRDYIMRYFDITGDGYLDEDEISRATVIDFEEHDYDEETVYYLDGIEYFTNLKELNCAGQCITKLDLSKCTKLERIVCYYNQLTTLDISKLTMLEKLDCEGNYLTNLDVSDCELLEFLDCSYNQLTSLDVSNCTMLKRLECNGNKLTELDVSKCTLLEALDCRDNLLTVLDISNCSIDTEKEHIMRGINNNYYYPRCDDNVTIIQ